jgi:hypothetical protein
VRVAELVESDDGDAGPSGDPRERWRDRVRVDGVAVAVSEYPCVELDSGRGCFGALERSPGFEDRERGGVEVDRAASVAGLTPGLVDLVADRDEPAVEGEALALEVDVIPIGARAPRCAACRSWR